MYSYAHPENIFNLLKSLSKLYRSCKLIVPCKLLMCCLLFLR